jgi:hypothetical protein
MIEIEPDDIPDALRQKPIIQTGAIALSKFKRIDPTDEGLYLGTLCMSDPYKRALQTGVAASFFNELANVYREIYGNSPWNEYLACSQTGCLGKKSIFDVHGILIENQSSLTKLEALKPPVPKDHGCPICGSPMRLYYSC